MWLKTPLVDRVFVQIKNNRGGIERLEISNLTDLQKTGKKSDMNEGFITVNQNQKFMVDKSLLSFYIWRSDLGETI